MSEPQQRLQDFIERTLREQPARTAPPDLETRVLAELARRAALPWWRKGFVHWPMAARLAFCMASVGFVKLGVDAALWLVGALNSTPVAAAISADMSWLRSTLRALSILITSWSLVIRNISDLWLYGGMALMGVMYAATAGLGVAAYRTLYADR